MGEEGVFSPGRQFIMWVWNWMQGNRQLCLLINWSWCLICFLLMPIPHWFIGCGQRINAFRVPAFAMSSASGSVPLVPYLPSKGGLFLSPSWPLKISTLHSYSRTQGIQGWPIETPKENAISTTQRVLGRNLPCSQTRAACMIDRTQALESLSPGFKSQFWYTLALWSWENHLTSWVK